MARRKYYETSLLKRIRLAVSRFESLGDGLANGSPESIQAELDRVRGLQKVIRENLPAVERLFKTREILGRIKEIERQESQTRGLLKSIFQGSLSSSARSEIESLRAQVPQGDFRTDFYEDVSADSLRTYDKNLAAYERLLERSRSSAEERERNRAEIAARRAVEKELAHSRQVEKKTRIAARRVVEDELARSRQVEKKTRIAAMAAAHAGKTRQLAQTVRRNIEHQRVLLDFCPYCGGVLGEDPEADHIYPVARGGLSTVENMVFVCAPCNKKKRDKTLREFIKTMKFDHLAVEQRLELLGKRF